MKEYEAVPHPGIRIKEEVIPHGMPVTKAAQLIGVSRPTLSKLLNGNASLSADMAMRLEKAFNYQRNDLMEMQAAYDAAKAKQKSVPANTKTYVPPFLAIKANDIEQWVSHNIPARSRMAVFLRTLIHSTGSGLTKVVFHGNDDAERPGWDGVVEAEEGTPWVPVGSSGWEFGINEDPKKKADQDFAKSVKALDEKEMAEMTFVFVTPRRWPGLDAWVKAKKAQGLWKDVRAYDASDLEQWLEQSLSGQAWFANERQMPADDVRSLDRCWAKWANVSTPSLPGSLFTSAIEATKRIMLSRLSKSSDGPIVIAADSTDEALAFVAQILSERGGEELAAYRDRVLVFDKPGVLPRLAEAAQTFIPIVHTRDVECELAPYAKSMHSIVIYPRNAVNSEPDIILEPVGYDIFSTALQEMGKDRDEITRLASASGRSLTVLRRQLATVQAVRTPEWAVDPQIASCLVPFLFVGAWHSANETDKIGLSLLAGDRPYDELEREFQRLTHLNDAPTWSIGTYRGVVSKIDLLYAISDSVTAEDLTRYYSMAGMVLGEDDPALDLPEDKRWAASIHGKTRKFSGVFRQGISETLVLLAIHGGNLFKGRHGVDTEVETIKVIRDLLPTPLTTRILEANDADLPTYAEAAPDEFLTILERDLKNDKPAVLGLLRPTDSSLLWTSPSRTGLLWALEGLSWNPVTFPRATFILARLAQVEIKDNWVNKPIHSLETIFRAWMPQTAASHEARVRLLKRLAEKFPDVAWKLCMSQFGSNHQVGNYSHKPRWRPDGYGFGEPFPTLEPVIAFVREVVEMALSWRDYSLSMLCDLVERLHSLTKADQGRVWALIEDWAKDKANDADKAVLREKIRVSALSRRAAIRTKKSAKAVTLVAVTKTAYAALEPSDLLQKHVWLFKDTWVEESADEIEDIEEIDFDKREERIKNLRVGALQEIYENRSIAGLLELAQLGNASWVIGRLLARAVLSEDDLQLLLRRALGSMLSAQGDVQSYKHLVAGAVYEIDDDKREAILLAVAADLSEKDTAQLLVLAPFCKKIWSLVDTLGEDAQAKYWNEITPDWIHSCDAENNEAVERLMKAGRPRAAFSCIKFHPVKLDPQVLYRLLSEMAKSGNDKPGQYMLEHYHVEAAFKHINNSSALSLDQKAILEFAYLEVLARRWDRNGYGIPNLERYIELHPEVFVQAITWTFKRKDGATDPAEFQIPLEQAKSMAERGYSLLKAIERIPGHNDLGVLEAERLAKWIAEVRQSASQLSRSDIADECIGQVLSCAPVGKDGVWPCEVVRDVLEDIQPEHIMNGARIGVYNSRGVHFRGEGGEQERELAGKYRKWGQSLQMTHPFVSSALLMKLAKTYDDEATQADTEARIRRRLP